MQVGLPRDRAREETRLSKDDPTAATLESAEEDATADDEQRKEQEVTEIGAQVQKGRAADEEAVEGAEETIQATAPIEPTCVVMEVGSAVADNRQVCPCLPGPVCRTVKKRA